MNKFTKRIAWTGQIWIAMLCAFLVGSIASMVLAADPNSAGMTWEQFADFFGWDPNDAAIALEDYDGDGLSNLSEWYQRTDPSRADTDGNGLPDGISPAISRARMDFHPLFTDGDSLHYFWPTFMVSLIKAGGVWDSDLPAWLATRSAWYLPAGTSGKLCMVVDRSLLTSDVVLELEFYDAPNASLFVDLINDEQEVLISSESEGNLIAGSGMIVREALHLPLKDYLQANRVIIRGRGELFLFEGLLYPAVPDLATGGDKAVQGRDASPRHPSSDGSAGHAKRHIGNALATPKEWLARDHHPPAVQATRLKSITIPQFVMAQQADGQSWMSGLDYIMSRDALDGGGTRQTSPAFIMEDSFAQSSAIGFSYGNNITLHAGYQQADDKLLEIWNAGVIPPVFNPRRDESTALSYVLSTRPRSVSIEVSNAATFAAFTLTNNMPQGPGLQTFVWNGRDTNGNYVGLGEWTFLVRAGDYQGRVIITNTPVGLMQIPVIRSVSDSPDPFCPTNETTTISYTTDAAQNLDVTIVIEDAYGNPVTNFSALNQAPGSYSYNWDGTGAARNGLFIYRINARRAQGGGPLANANEKTGSIILACDPECVTSQDGNVRVCYQPDGFSISITGAAPDQISVASRAIFATNLLFQSRIYDIKADPPASFDPPLILTFKYDPAIIGDIDAKLQIRRYDESVTNWVVVSPQFIDYANHRIIAEVTNLSLFAVFAGEEPAAPVVLKAEVKLEPEALNVNPGILTAFVSLPAGYPASGIASATCDGALYEQMMLSNDGNEMIIKFRRQDIETALAQTGESIDIDFIVRGVWQDSAGNSYVFQGADSITKIVGAR